MRGDARRLVPPDHVKLACRLAVAMPSKAEALQAAAAATDGLIGELAAAGGVPLRADTERRLLTWSTTSVTTSPESGLDPRSGRYETTGRVTATVAVWLAVRDFTMLDGVAELLIRQGGFHIQHVLWGVDEDNPAWPEVRAEAVGTALRRGQDYAAALGGRLESVELLADVGLSGYAGSAEPASHAMSGPDLEQSGPVTPSLDPVPQQLVATVEARFTATGVSLPPGPE